MTLEPMHIAELEKRGISCEFAQSHGAWSELNLRWLACICDYTTWRLGTGLVIPFLRPDDHSYPSRTKNNFFDNEFLVVKLDKPTPKRKYVQPQGKSHRVYVPHEVLRTAKAANGPMQVVVVEGILKCWTLIEQAYAHDTIAILGCQMWGSTNKECRSKGPSS